MTMDSIHPKIWAFIEDFAQLFPYRIDISGLESQTVQKFIDGDYCIVKFFARIPTKKSMITAKVKLIYEPIYTTYSTPDSLDIKINLARVTEMIGDVNSPIAPPKDLFNITELEHYKLDVTTYG